MNHRFDQPTASRVPRGRLSLTVRGSDGQVLARRDVHNMVLRAGAELIARRFAGLPEAGPIDRVQVGFGREVVSADTTALTAPPGADVPAAALATALAPSAFSVTTDQPGVVSVAVNAVFVPTVDLADVTEAALASAERLHNQVVFEPVHLRVGQNVTFFWQIDFPFG